MSRPTDEEARMTPALKAWCRKHGHEFAPTNSPIAPRSVFCVFCGAVRNGVVMPEVRHVPH